MSPTENKWSWVQYISPPTLYSEPNNPDDKITSGSQKVVFVGAVPIAILKYGLAPGFGIRTDPVFSSWYSSSILQIEEHFILPFTC